MKLPLLRILCAGCLFLLSSCGNSDQTIKGGKTIDLGDGDPRTIKIDDTLVKISLNSGRLNIDATNETKKRISFPLTVVELYTQQGIKALYLLNDYGLSEQENKIRKQYSILKTFTYNPLDVVGSSAQMKLTLLLEQTPHVRFGTEAHQNMSCCSKTIAIYGAD